MPDSVTAGLRGGADVLVLAGAGLEEHPVLIALGPVTPLDDAPQGRHPKVLLAFADRTALRSASLPPKLRGRTVAVWLTGTDHVAGLVARPEWPAIDDLRVRRPEEGGVLTTVRFAGPVPVAAVLAELGRRSVWSDRAVGTTLFLATGDERVPPDVTTSAEAGVSEVTGRAPYVVTEPAPVRPVDERVVNPIGYDARADGPVVDLAGALGSPGPPSTEALVASLRAARGVRVDLTSTPLDVVAALACAGVPLTAAAVPAEVRAALGDRVADALAAPVDLDDALAREEHSVVLRRAALGTLSRRASHADLARLAEVRSVEPTVSVVLATKRPEQLEFALAQVAAQRGAGIELVLAPHGFEPDPGRVAELAGDLAVELAPAAEDTLFGDVLAGAVERASGELVLKMDDDDWYSPDFVADLLLARGYSGADLVGCAAEFHYLSEVDLTARRGHPAECFTNFVAGGTMLIERALLRSLGSFRPVRKFVDAQLLAALAREGGTVYRTHGLGYVLRRNPTGHTWDADLDYLLAPERTVATTPGFSPSRLLHG